MSKMWRILSRALVIIFLMFVFVAPVSAQENPLDAETQEELPDTSIGGIKYSPEMIQKAIDAPTPNLANTTAYIYYTLLVTHKALFNPDSADTGAITGPEVSLPSPTSVSDALNRDGVPGAIGFLVGGMIKEPQVSGQVYVADLVQNSKFVPQPAYAQAAPGLGFVALNPVLGTWKAFRNVAYYLLTIMFFITGFLILIRHKVSGNVAVTAQSALPRLVITLIMITFSYAIAGFVVDLMFFAIYFIINIFTQILGSDFTIGVNGLGGVAGERSLSKVALDTHIFSFFLSYVFDSKGGAWSAADALGDMVYDGIAAADPTDILDTINVGGLFSGILDVIFVLIFGIALLIAMFRTFFQLLMSYAGFIMNVALSPLILLQEAIPGLSKGGFGKWVKSLIGGLAPFVICIFMIFMSLTLTGAREGVGYNRESPDQDGLRLPLILSDEIRADAFIGVLGMGFMLLLPEAVGMSKKMFGGGIMDEYKDKAMKNFQQGITGAKNPLGFGPGIPGAQRAFIGDKTSRTAAAEARKKGDLRAGGFMGNRYGVIGAGLSTANQVRLGRLDTARAAKMTANSQPAQQNLRPIQNMNPVVGNTVSFSQPTGASTPASTSPAPAPTQRRGSPFGRGGGTP